MSLGRITNGNNGLITFFLASNPVPVKALMNSNGQINSPKCRAPLNHNDMSDMDLLEKSNQQVNDWYTSQTK